MGHNLGSEDSSFPNRSGVCHRHRWAHSGPHVGPLGDMKVEFVWCHHEICQSLLCHFRRVNFHVRDGTLHNQGVVETVQEMERRTSAQTL
jgi:hypothetical protein